MNRGSVLMIEPNPGILIVARNVLARAGFGVLAVSNARQGVKLVAQRRIDVVLLDSKQATPGILESLGLAAQPSLQVLLTVQKGRDADPGVLEAAAALRLDLREVIEKPFSPEHLLGAIDRAFARGRARQAPMDTLVNVDAIPFGEEVVEHDKTDIFPFAHLLQTAGVNGDAPSDDPFDDDETNVGIPLDATKARRSARLRAVLEDLRPDLPAELVSDCLRACETALEAEPEPSAAPVSNPHNPVGTLVVAGYVGHLAIDQILQLPTAVDGRARCRLENGGAAIDVHYDGPRITFARQDNLPAGFMLGQVLVAAGLASEADIEEVLDPRRGLRGWLGQRLVRAGVVTETAIREALRRQTEELVYEVVRWREGRFSVFTQELLPAEVERADLAVPVQHLLLEGMRRLDEWQRIEGEVGDLGAVLRPLDGARTQDVVRSLSPEDRLVLQHIDGTRTVAELVQSVARPSFDVFRALHSLAGRKLVAVGT